MIILKITELRSELGGEGGVSQVKRNLSSACGPGRKGADNSSSVFPRPQASCFFCASLSIYTLFDGFTDNTRGYFASSE